MSRHEDLRVLGLPLSILALAGAALIVLASCQAHLEQTPLGQDDDDSASGTDADGDGYSVEDGDCDDGNASVHPGAAEICDGIDNDCDGDTDEGAYGSSADCPAETCLDLLQTVPEAQDGTYWIDPAGTGAFEVPCDMTTDGGGWTVVEFASDLPYQNHFDGEDTWLFLPADFSTVLTTAQIEAIQAESSDGFQQYVGLCNSVLHYEWAAQGHHDFAFGFRFLDGTETSYGQASYSPHDISVTQDGCSANGDEGGTLANATVFEIDSPLVPVVNVISNDHSGSSEMFGSPLTDHPARLR